MEKFLVASELGEPLTVTLPGTQTRLFTHIYDVIDALKIIANKGSGDGYVISSDEAVSIRELAHMISDKIDFVPGSPANRMQTKLMNKKTKELGWLPKFGLKQYLYERVQERLK